jgi:spore protease
VAKGVKENMNRNIRTDLAIELRENIEDSEESLTGIDIDTLVNKEDNIKTTIIKVINEKGAKKLGKPRGTYITIECPDIKEFDEGIHEPLCRELAGYIKQLLGGASSVLVAGLGNREVTPDSLGPLVADNIFVTRHLAVENIIQDKSMKYTVSAVCPGVMAQTGIETVEIIRGICSKIDVDAVIVVDALAARNSSRLNSTIQLTDTGISPGSGVGNNRKAINENNIKRKVIAIGVPTVIAVPSLIDDSLDAIAEAFNQTYGKDIMKEFTEEQRYEMACNLVEPDMAAMFVTPKNIDELIKRISFTISEAINSMIFE